MKRRTFLQGAASTAAVATLGLPRVPVAAPVVSEAPTYAWKLLSSTVRVVPGGENATLAEIVKRTLMAQREQLIENLYSNNALYSRLVKDDAC